MARMQKKSIIKLSIFGGIVLAAGLGIGIPAALVSPKVVYQVNIKSVDDSRYLVTEMDTQQNKPKLASKDIWDIPSKESDLIDIVAEELNRDRMHVIATIAGNAYTHNYSNGLEKLFYDLLNADSRKSEKLTIVFPGKQFVFNKNFLDGDLEARYNILKDHKALTTVYAIDDKGTKDDKTDDEELKSNFGEQVFTINIATKNSVAPTTEADYLYALNRIYLILK